MDYQLQGVAQGLPSLPCLLPFIMGCLVKDARAAPAAQIWTGEPAILPEDTLHLPLVARLLINTEDDGPLAGSPTQGDTSSDTNVKGIDPNSIETAAQSEPTFTVEERPGSARSLATPIADDGPGTAQVVATLSRDGTSARSLPTDTASAQDSPDSADTKDQTEPDFRVDDGPGTERLVATPTRDGTSARSLPTDATSVQDSPDSADTKDQTDPGLPVDDGPGTARIVATLTRDGTSARSLPTDAASVPEDDLNPIGNDNAKLRARDSSMTLSSVYLLLG